MKSVHQEVTNQILAAAMNAELTICITATDEEIERLERQLGITATEARP
jgi:hypothetical protein